jgi:hypothetical protein
MISKSVVYTGKIDPVASFKELRMSPEMREVIDGNNRWMEATGTFRVDCTLLVAGDEHAESFSVSTKDSIGAALTLAAQQLAAKLSVAVETVK